MRDIRQLKLANGEEIICEIIEDQSVDPEVYDYPYPWDMFIKNVMKLELKVYDSDPDEEPYRYYALNPWMVYGEQKDKVISLKSDAVIAECDPSPLLMDQYVVGIEEMNRVYEYKMESRNKFKDELKKAGDFINKAQKRLEEKKAKELDLTDKEKDSNVIKLFNKKDDDTLH